MEHLKSNYGDLTDSRKKALKFNFHLRVFRKIDTIIGILLLQY